MISVIIPYNKDRGYLQECIESIENQTYKNFEIILSKSDASVGRNINQGVKKAKGEFIKYIAEDDLLTPNSLEDLRKGIDNYDWCVADAVNFEGSKEPVSKWLGYVPELKKMFTKEHQIHGGTTLFKRDLWARFGGFDESLTTAEEYDWQLKLLFHKIPLTYVHSVVCMYRLWSGSKSQGVKRNDYIEKIRNRYR